MIDASHDKLLKELVRWVTRFSCRKVKNDGSNDDWFRIQEAEENVHHLGQIVLARMSYPSHDRAMAEGGWKDIASVPQDGPVLLWLREPFARVEIARWDWRLDCFVSPDEMTEFGKLMPSHWQALPPAPPTPTTKEETDK